VNIFIKPLAMTNWSLKIRQQKFDDSRRMIPAILFGNLILFFFLIAFHSSGELVKIHLISLATTLLFTLGIYKIYNWENQSINITVLLFYLLICVLEFGIAGLPETYMSYSYYTRFYEKGMMFDLLVSIYPLTFLLLRFTLALPILTIIMRRRVLSL